MAEDTQRQHLPFIDGLRALAILPVVMFHAWPGLLPGGFIGVDVFFVISGFLITRLIVGELADGRFSLTRFLLRRARRLLPAAVFCFAVTSLIAALWLTPDALVNYGRSLMAACLMYANIYFYQTAGYFSAPSLEKPLLHVWSLAVEDQFYLVWPLVLFAFLPRLPSRFAVIGAMALGIASFIIATVAVRLKPDFAFYLLPARAFELMAGAALALCAETVIRWLNIARPIVLEVLGGLGLLAIGASTFVFSQLTPFAGPNAVPVTLGTVAVIASGLGQPTLTSRLLEWPLFIGIGLISYSLYLWHWPLLALLSYRLERPLQPLEAGLVVALAFGLAMLSWRFIEQPFRRAQPANLRFIGAALVATIALVGAGAAMKADRGWPWRYTGPERAMMQQLAATNPYRAKCDNYWQALTNNDACNFGKKKPPDESFEIAIFGDSMADHWVPLLADYAKRTGHSGRQVTNGGCGALLGVALPDSSQAKERECADYQKALETFIEQNKGLKLVVLAGYWQKWQARIDGRKLAPPTSPFALAMAGTIKRLRDRGILVHIIGQTPGFPTLPIRCVLRETAANGNADACGMPGPPFIAQAKPLSDFFTRLTTAGPGISYSAPETFMCGPTICPPVMDGILLYRDTGHVNAVGAVHLGKFIRLPELP